MSQTDKNRGILEYAVTQEDRDYEFFMNLARHADQSEKRELFERLAGECVFALFLKLNYRVAVRQGLFWLIGR